jgi:2-C-methyl-D-erythritol 2,4-cyclodiphosphate synthase
VSMRVGLGFDAHPLVSGRPLILGGVEVPFDKGLSGHSDGDVVVHALMDALLGAAALGDKGVHFPSSDPSLKGISSLLLLKRTASLVSARRWRVVNVDATILAQRPRLGPYIGGMRENLAQALGTDQADVSIKATTTDHMGFAGRGEGLAAYAVALLEAKA